MNAKILALMMVGVMMVSGFSIIADADENTLDAVVGDGGAYSYTLTYHPDQMANTAAQELQLTVAGMTPISHNPGTITLSSVVNEGSWGFNTTTGVGPFNSFYAAFDMNDGNKFVSILNPYDLTKKINGASLGDMSGYNVMWILPTVYWSVDNDGNLTLTNNPSGGTAYAHTIDGHVYRYLAIGVYKGSTKTVGDQTVLTSQSGATPTASQTRATFRDYANNYSMDDSLGAETHSMLWNFYQWELYKYVCYTVMEGFNSQMIVGNGNVYGNNYTMVNGLTDVLGPYAGNPGDLGASNTNASLYGQNAVKLFIENSWGTINDFIDGVVLFGNQTIYINSASEPDENTSGSYVERVDQTLPSSGFGATISTNEKTWGLAVTTSSSTDYYNKGTADKIYTTTSSFRIPAVGGAPDSSDLAASSGLSFISANNNVTNMGYWIGSRLAFVTDFSFFTTTVAIESDDPDYGSVSVSEIAEIEVGTEISISGNTLTIGETTVTATPTTADAQYTYAFSGWYDGETLLVDGDTVSSDMTITAVFTRTVNQYTATINNLNPGFGSVSVSSVTADYGSAISAASNVLTVGASTVTATPTTADAQYTYAFGQWGSYPATLTQDVTITVSFTQTVNSYTITWVYSGDSATETYLYGTMPSFPDPTPPADYRFAGWSPALAPVTQDQTYTAIFELINYLTVTFDPNGGTLEGPDTKVVGQYLPYGELPVPKLDNYVFQGWFTAPEDGEKITATSIVEVDDDQTLYAQWKLGGFPALMEKLLYLFPILLLSILALAILRVFV